jgi:hypothetical protein
MKCCNCDTKAAYSVADPGVNPLDYCNSCLPKHLKERAKAGHFPLAKPEKVGTSKEEPKA